MPLHSHTVVLTSATPFTTTSSHKLSTIATTLFKMLQPKTLLVLLVTRPLLSHSNHYIHWLNVEQRIQYKIISIISITHNSLHSSLPSWVLHSNSRKFLITPQPSGCTRSSNCLRLALLPPHFPTKVFRLHFSQCLANPMERNSLLSNPTLPNLRQKLSPSPLLLPFSTSSYLA